MTKLSPSQIKRLSKFATVCVIATSGLMGTGCGSSAQPAASSEKTTSSAAPAPETPAATANAADTAADAKGASGNSKVEAEISGDGKAHPEVAAPAAEPEKKPSQVAKADVVPTTAKDAIAAINLSELPRLPSNTVLQNEPTYLYYSSEGKLTDADTFYKSTMKSNGWEELPPMTPATEHYVDRLFTKNGFFVRVGLSLGGPDEVGVMLANLGNIDVRDLPRLADAEVAFQSTPVNVTYQTQSSIPDAAEAVHKQMTANGWQLWNEFHTNPVSVPHYKDFHYRKEACRLLVGIVKNPENPADKTSVSYISEFVTPFDVPMLSESQSLKLDVMQKQASFEMTNSRKDLVALLKSHSEKYGWKMKDEAKFEAGEVQLLPMDLASGDYVVARLVESGGKYSASLESYAKPSSVPEKPTEPEVAESIANNEEMAEENNAKVEHDATTNAIESQINSAIQGELAKALGSLGQPANGSPADLAELQSKADQLKAMLNVGEDATGDDSDDEPAVKENPFDVSEDENPPAVEIQAIEKSKVTVKYGDKTLDLPHIACYVIKDFGATVKCILCSDSPIDKEKLQRMLLKEGKAVHGLHVSENATHLIDFRVYDESLSLNAQFESSSLGMSTGSIPTKVSYHGGKFKGKIATAEPIELNDRKVEFTVEVCEEPLQIDWSKRGSPDMNKLVADSSKDVLVPEGCTSFSSEGSQYYKNVDAAIEAPLAAVQAFYDEQFAQQGLKQSGEGDNGVKLYASADQEASLSLESQGAETVIKLQTRDMAAAKEDEMLPPKGKSILALANMSQGPVEMTIAGKKYAVGQTDGTSPKSATKVVVEPGKIKVKVTDKSGKTYNIEVDAKADTAWAVLFDADFQDSLRLF